MKMGNIITMKISKKDKFILKKIGENIHYARLRRGLTQEQLAKKIGISQYHVSRMEWGDQVMKITLLFKFSKALNIMPEEIIDLNSEARFRGMKGGPSRII